MRLDGPKANMEHVLLDALFADHNSLSGELTVSEGGDKYLWTEDNECINVTQTARQIFAAVKAIKST